MPIDTNIYIYTSKYACLFLYILVSVDTFVLVFICVCVYKAMDVYPCILPDVDKLHLK